MTLRFAKRQLLTLGVGAILAASMVAPVIAPVAEIDGHASR